MIAAIVLSVLHALLLIEDDHIVSSGGSNTVSMAKGIEKVSFGLWAKSQTKSGVETEKDMAGASMEEYFGLKWLGSLVVLAFKLTPRANNRMRPSRIRRCAEQM